jgi:hypothetical protein
VGLFPGRIGGPRVSKTYGGKRRAMVRCPCAREREGEGERERNREREREGHYGNTKPDQTNGFIP